MTDYAYTLLLLIHEPEGVRAVVDDIIAEVCPHLNRFGQKSIVAKLERVRELKAGEAVAHATLVRLVLSGEARVPVEVLVAKLERFFKQAAKDADIAMRVELMRVDSEEPS